jgi:hypothetical protein
MTVLFVLMKVLIVASDTDDDEQKANTTIYQSHRWARPRRAPHEFAQKSAVYK